MVGYLRYIVIGRIRYTCWFRGEKIRLWNNLMFLSGESGQTLANVGFGLFIKTISA